MAAPAADAPSTDQLFTRGGPNVPDNRGLSMVAKHLEKQQKEKETRAMERLHLLLPALGPTVRALALQKCYWDEERALTMLRRFQVAKVDDLSKLHKERRRHQLALQSGKLEKRHKQGSGSDGGSGSDSDSGSGSGSGGSGGKGEGEEDGEEDFLDLQQAEEMAASKGIELPEDFRAAAGPEGGGLRRSALEGYFKLAGGGWLTSLLVRSLPAFRNRLLADRLFFFKVAAEVMIDSGCATVAELRKRGDDFWGEFEFYLSDLMVGLVLDVVLVTLLAPPALIGRSRAASATGLKKLLGRLPSAVFQKSLPGRRFTILERGGTFVKLGLEYSLAGIVCGFIGQGIANSLMRLKRHYGTTSEHDVAVPPLMRTALVWGLFMGVSSNSRYQVVFGLERIVDQTIARRIPQVAYFTTLAIRFANNVVGGENFIDMARWAGVQ